MMLRFDTHSLNAMEAPSRRDYVYAILGFAFGIVLVLVQIDRLQTGLRSGRLLVTDLADMNWYVQWSSSPTGFALAFVMHLTIFAVAIGLIWYGCLTVRLWYHKR